MEHLKGEVAQKRMLEDAKHFILASGEFRTVSDIAQLLGVDRHKLSQRLKDWKNRGMIFSISCETQGELFPFFALERST